MSATEAYIGYWGLERHPFLLAPDSGMMYVAGQYFECLERLTYAVNTNKGGALLVSEDAGLGKTTVLLKLVEELRTAYGDAFRCAVVDHPTLSPSQIVAHITGAITGTEPHTDKLRNLTILREALIDIHRQGGKSVIIVDEGQMLCAMPDVLQELRILINLTHGNEYLHTFILSGQRALWNAVKGIPEFWQRLPVRYYLLPLELEDTRGIIGHRLAKAGLEDGREIFADDAVQIIHRYARGSPRTILALADLCLLVGFSGRAGRITFKEVSKAMNAMSGRGESLPYVKADDRAAGGAPAREGPTTGPVTTRPAEGATREKEETARADHRVPSPRMELNARKDTAFRWKKEVTRVVTMLLLLAGAAGYAYVAGLLLHGWTATERERDAVQEPQKTREAHPGPPSAPQEQARTSPEAPAGGAPVAPGGTAREEVPARLPFRDLVVMVSKANVRGAPGLDSPVVGAAEKGNRLSAEEERMGEEGYRWYRIALDGDREGWIAETVVIVVREKTGPR
jgi:type II secretory pathway predicted ATPase ExeA